MCVWIFFLEILRQFLFSWRREIEDYDDEEKKYLNKIKKSVLQSRLVI